MNLEEITVAKAMSVLRLVMQEDEGYALGWQANIAMSLYDELGDRIPHDEKIEVCNQAAGRFMKAAFDVDGYALWKSDPDLSETGSEPEPPSV